MTKRVLGNKKFWKSLLESKTFWLALIQGVLGAVAVAMNLYPEVGALAIVKSFFDVVLRVYTVKEIKQ